MPKPKKKPAAPPPARKARTVFGGDGALAGLPTWVRAFAWAGFPAAVASAVLWFVIHEQGQQLGRIEQALAAQGIQQAIINEHIRADSSQNAMLVSIAQRICLNTSKSDLDRMSCVYVRGDGK